MTKIFSITEDNGRVYSLGRQMCSLTARVQEIVFTPGVGFQNLGLFEVIFDTPNVSVSLSKRLVQKVTYMTEGVPFSNVVDYVEPSSTQTSLRIKLGADPTRPDLHLGHAVVLKKLREFQDMGHKAILIIGDFTAQIGDPTGRNKTRPSLDRYEIERNAETYLNQCGLILDTNPDKLEIHYNSKWFSGFGFSEVIQLCSRYSVARMLERDDFSKRLKAQTLVSLHELLYPLAQAYDSVMVKADLEIGGTDQLFNLLVGRDIQRDYGQAPQGILTCPILVGTDGVLKMSKSSDNFIPLTDPWIIFQKLMQLPDDLLEHYFLLLLGSRPSGDLREDHFHLASRMVEWLHPSTNVEDLDDRYRLISSGGIPEGIQVKRVATTSMSIVDMGMISGFMSSRNDVRRMIKNRGVKINGFVIEDPSLIIDLQKPVVFQVGKDRFMKFVGLG